MGGTSKKQGKQRGAAFEIKCVADTIRTKEINGMDATFERELLKAWVKHPGYQSAKAALASLSTRQGRLLQP